MQIKTYTRRAVGLRIAINQQRFKFKHGKTGSQVYRRGSFSHSAFLIGDSYHSTGPCP